MNCSTSSMMTKQVLRPVDDGDRAAAAAAAVDQGSDDDSDHDNDHPQQEPEFVIHAVDDYRRRRAPVPPRPLLPIQHHQPPPQHEPAGDRDAARIERLHYFMLFPQAILSGWTMLFGGMMIYYAVQPDMRPDPHFIWVIVFTSLIMLCALLSLLLSHLGVYVYDRCPGLNNWLH